MNVKPTNPKDSVGIKKVPTHVFPPRIMAEVGLALLEGARKYGSYNWRAAGVRASVYYDAVDRHLGAWWEGQDLDPDSGLSHVTKAIAGLTVLRDSMMQGNWTDDRPIRSDEHWLPEMNAKAGALIDKYPEAKAPFTAARAALEAAHPLVTVDAAKSLLFSANLSKRQPTIWLDMDGVLADFDEGARQALGTDNTYQWEFQHGAKAFWEKLDADPNFFGNLPPMKDMRKLWNAVKGRDVRVLTALPRTGADAVDLQKRDWIARRLGKTVPVITCQTFEKPNFCHPGDVLVDDRTVNREKWEAAGGVFIHHVDAETTIKALAAANYI